MEIDNSNIMNALYGDKLANEIKKQIWPKKIECDNGDVFFEEEGGHRWMPIYGFDEDGCFTIIDSIEILDKKTENEINPVRYSYEE